MLDRNQRYSIASSLSVGSLGDYIRKVKSIQGLFTEDTLQEIIDFAVKIDKLFVKKDGFIPKKVLVLCR